MARWAAPCALLVLLAAPGCVDSWGDGAGTASAEALAVAEPAGAAALWTRTLGETDGPEDAVAALRERARAAAERLRTAPAETVEADREELATACAALAHAPDAATLPWAEWLAEEHLRLPLLAVADLRAAELVLGPDVLDLARPYDRRLADEDLRLEVHRLFWLYDPAEAAARSRRLFLREAPRARPFLQQRWLEELAPRVGDARIVPLLEEIAASDAQDTYARRLALRELGRRASPTTPAICESIFRSERGDLLTRKEALALLLELDPARGRRVLTERLPEEEVDPSLAAFLDGLRSEQGVAVEP